MPEDTADSTTSSSKSVTYTSYLKVEELLSLQELKSDPPEHDELLFIVIHQVYELWFKQVLHELDQFADHLDDDLPYKGMHQLKRVLKIFKTLVAQLDVLETMTPLEFGSFREFLDGASGFQSVQFRELEYLLGMKDPVHLDRVASSGVAEARLRDRYEERTVWDAVLGHLSRRGFLIPTDQLDRDVTEPLTESPGVQAALIEVYRTEPSLSSLLEALTDLDEGLQEWRYRHVKMVQRTIGAKIGTGGSAGAAYLQSTLFRPVFPDLWEIRTDL